MIIPFEFIHVFETASDPVDNAKVLRILLECLINIDRAYLQRHNSTAPLYRSGVVYRRTQTWDPIPTLYAKGFGDCKSLTAALIAQYRESGVNAEPVFRWARSPRFTGNVYHILVQTHKGFEDPSKVLGMSANAVY